MDKAQVINELVKSWINIAEHDLLTAEQGLKAENIITDTVCFHCQQAAEKYLKAFLVKHQVEFSKTHSMMVLVNLCSSIDLSFSLELTEVDLLTDYAVEIRYPDDWYEPTIEEANQAFQIALKVKNFVRKKIN